MFTALLQAGGNVNNPGNDKCGKYPIDHAIQHQRLDSVQVSEMSVRVGMRDQWRIYIVNFERAPARSNFLHFIQFSGNFGRIIGHLPEILDPPLVLTQNAKSIEDIIGISVITSFDWQSSELKWTCFLFENGAKLISS